MSGHLDKAISAEMELTALLHQISFETMKSEEIEAVKMGIADLLAVAFAGSASEEGEIFRQYFYNEADRQEATAWDETLAKFSFANAAALNAAYAHTLDMDDVHNASIAHLGAVTIPAALAVGQKYHCSGKDVIAAIAAGYEMGARVGESIVPESYHFWHTTSIVGGFSSAVATGKLLNLDKDTLLHAIGSAGTQAAGLWQFVEDGAMSKLLHTANATLCGIRAAVLSSLGLTGAKKVLTGRRGLLDALTKENHPQKLTEGLTKGKLRIMGNSFKPYPCCRHAHAAVYCLELIKKERQIKPQEIEQIRDYTYRVAKQTIDDGAPATVYGHKFSLQYCLAAMMVYGKLSQQEFTQTAVSNLAVTALMQRITVIEDAALEAENAADRNCWPHRLEIVLKDGTVLIKQVRFPFGDFNNPFSWQDMQEKYSFLANDILPAAQAEKIFGLVRQLEQVEDINTLFD